MKTCQLSISFDADLPTPASAGKQQEGLLGTSLNMDSANIQRANNNVDAKPKATTKEQNWLTRALFRGRTERFTETVMVTPGLAVAMLVHNLGNRPLVRAHIDKHIGRLTRGDFVLTHLGISFARTGVLNDGQHRLLSIAECGIGGWLQVTFGAERQEFDVIDQGKPRTAGHLLAVKGETNANLRASIAKALMPKSATMRLYDPDMQQVVEHALTMRGDAIDTAIVFSMSMRKVCAQTASAVAHYLIETQTAKPDKFPAFKAGLASGEGLSGVKLKLREWLISRDSLSTHDSTTRGTQRSAGIIHAWNAYLLGRRSFQTKWTHVLTYPKPM